MNRLGSVSAKHILVSPKALVGLLSIFILTACGGGGVGGSSNSGGNGGGSTSDWVSGVFESADNFKDLCEVPRSGAGFSDLAGSTLDENNWLRSYSNDTYLWYDEIVDRDPALYATPDYFELLKTTATTASGAAKDQFHFTYDTEEWEQLSQSGVSAGYGFEEALISDGLPNEIVIVYVDPDTPAADAGLMRGDRILSIDGFEIANPTQAEIDGFVAGLSPSETGESHSFVLQANGSSSTREVVLVSETIVSTPVLAVDVLPTDTGDVGYILFNDHIATAEQQLIDAVNSLNATGISDLVLDLRYNGGGFLAIGSQMAYMIAGDLATNGQTFEVTTFNDKHPVFNPVTGDPITPVPFYDFEIGFSETTTLGDPLPSLNLERVFVLTTGNTCSASEAIINGLRGVDIEVFLIGDTTCGKPYGFYGTDNCGTTYFTVQFQGQNAKGFGDYADGFEPADLNSPGAVAIPGCGVDDDFGNQLGDPSEAMLAKALEFRATGSCESLVSFSQKPFASSAPTSTPTKAVLQKNSWLQNRDLRLPNE